MTEQSGSKKEIRMAALKNATGFFFCMLLAGVCRNLLSKGGWNWWNVPASPIIAAVVFYIFKRKDLFD